MYKYIKKKQNKTSFTSDGGRNCGTKKKTLVEKTKNKN